MVPEDGFSSKSISLSRAVFPDPVGPTRAVLVPFFYLYVNILENLEISIIFVNFFQFYYVHSYT